MDNKNAEKLKKSKERLRRIKTLFEMGDIDVEEYKLKRDMLVAEIESYDSSSKEPIQLVSNWKEIYEQLDVIHKNAFWKSIIASIEVPSRKASTVKIQFK